MDGDIAPFVYIVIAVLFGIYRLFNSKKEKNQQPKTVSNPTPSRSTTPNTPTSTPKKAQNKGQSIEDIFSDFVKELENNQNKGKTPTKTKPSSVQSTASTVEKKAIEWQGLSHSKIKPKQQQIRHEDYADISHRNTNIDDNPIAATAIGDQNDEPDFNIHEIDWRSAIIQKEILERKYS